MDSAAYRVCRFDPRVHDELRFLRDHVPAVPASPEPERETIEMLGATANDLATKREEYLRPAQAAAMLHVSPQTVRRWAAEGKLRCVLTAGGHRRFPRSEVQRLRQQLQRDALQVCAPFQSLRTST